jgi:hypothetical protein
MNIHEDANKMQFGKDNLISIRDNGMQTEYFESIL